MSVPAGRAAAALCWLVLHANDAVPPDSLVPVLWAQPPPSAAARVRTVVRALVPLFDPGTLQVNGQLRLMAPDDSVDARRFERLVLEVRRDLGAGDVADPARRNRAQTDLRAALDLWRGPACPELDHARPARRRIDTLTELRLGAQEDLNALVLRGGVDYPEVADLRAQVILHPLRPRVHRQLAIALYRTHRQVEALEVLRDLRATLGDPDGLAGALQDAMLRQAAELHTGEHPAG